VKFLSLLVALALEQAWPLRQANPVHALFARYVELLEAQLNGGQRRHGVIAWLLAVVPIVAAVAAVSWLLHGINPAAAWTWNVAVLYFTMGFRRFSHSFTEIQQALRTGDLAAARQHLGNWRGEPATEFNAAEIARVTIEQGLLASHRHVFGPIFWFVALGPAGAVLYYAATTLAEIWGVRREPESVEFGRFATRAFFWLDWAPARLTAASFAVVGDFEDAIYCWRSQAASWNPQSHGIILSAGAGALGVRLGDTLHQYGTVEYRPELGIGDEAEAAHMQQAVGLIWRTLVLVMFLILLVTLAHALG
jgi:adenosylcobinamide-phosphate synthase